jgi:hypothetical protein
VVGQAGLLGGDEVGEAAVRDSGTVLGLLAQVVQRGADF